MSARPPRGRSPEAEAGAGAGSARGGGREAKAPRSANEDARADERERAAETIEGQLTGRDVRLLGDETPEELADMLTAVQTFESTVAALGGDSMTNAPDSRYPDDRRLVLPQRADDETARAYIRRVTAAAEQLRGAR
jgi:hypothetical protein